MALALRRLARDVFDFCYPGRCAACEASCETANALCDKCDRALNVLESAAACGACGMPAAGPGGPCAYCQGQGFGPYERVLRVGLFRDPLKHLIHEMKYHGRWPIAEQLGDRLLARRTVRELLAESDCFVPVPLHRLRQLSRGYNQAEVIAAHLSARCGRAGRFRLRRRVPVVRPAVRLRHTETQTHLHSRARRLENLRDAFGLIKPGAITGRRVVVVDDVMTTGATLLSFARCLRAAKPLTLYAMVLAVADPKGQDFQAI